MVPHAYLSTDGLDNLEALPFVLEVLCLQPHRLAVLAEEINYKKVYIVFDL